MVENREETILRWLPFSWRCCRRFRKCGILLDDLRQEAVVGLIDAVDKFDPDKGPFMPYASKMINHQLIDMCAHQMRAYAIKRHLNATVNKVRKARESLRRKGIWDPSVLLLSEKSGLSIVRVVKALSVDRQRVPSNNLQAPEELESINVGELLAPLGVDDQVLLAQRYGLNDQPLKLLKELAKTEGVTRECIRKRQQRALDKVRRGAEA